MRRLRSTVLALWVLLVASCQPAQASQVCSTAAQNGATLYQAFQQHGSTPQGIQALYLDIVRAGLPSSQVTALVRGLGYLARRQALGEEPIDLARFAQAVHNTCLAVEVPDNVI